MSSLAGAVRWMPVETTAGPFSTESFARITDAVNDKYTVIVDNQLIRKHKEQLTLKVYIVNVFNRKNNIITVLLPTETLETSTRWINIKEKGLFK